MNIVYCLAGTFNSGGMERIVINKANWLTENGYDVTIITTEQNGRPDFFKLDSRIKRIDLDILYSETNSYSIVRKAKARLRLIKTHRERLTQVLFRIRPDIVVSTFGNEVGFLPSIKDGSRKVAEIHFSRWFRMQLNRTGLWHLIDKYLTRKDFNVLKRYDKFVCLTREDRENWKGLSNVDVIPNFIEQYVKAPAPLDSKSMIAVGRMSYQKGYERLIDAWRIVAERYPDWTLNIFGGGELYSELINQIKEANLSEKIHLHSPSSVIMSEYQKSSALVLSSRYEGLPMVLLEAMSVGLPLISFDCQCGPRDVIDTGVNGLLVKEGDIEGLANAIIELINNSVLRKKLGKNALEKSKSYSKEKVMKHWDDLFRSLQ